MSEDSSRFFIADLKASNTFPYSFAKLRKFRGPNTSKTIPKTNNRSVGRKIPSTIEDIVGVGRAAYTQLMFSVP